MRKLSAVEEAKALFEDAKSWGVWRWLTEKGRARRTADAAWEALDRCEQEIKASWNEDIRRAYHELEAMTATNGSGRARRAYDKAREEARGVADEVKLAVKRLKEADDEAYQARMDAEAQFDAADRRMSASMASEGAGMAIHAWELREKFIRKMEALGRRPKP